MINVKRFLEQIQYLWERRSTFKGLIGFLLVAYGLLAILDSVSLFILKNAQLLDNIGYFLKFAFISAGIYGFVTLCIIALWAYWRSIPKIRAGKIGIIFAPHSDLDCTELIQRLFGKFKLNCEKLKLTTDLSFKLLPDNFIVKDSEDAHKLIQQTGARLVIHGQIQRGKLHDESMEGFKPISFTIRHRSLSPS
jgi:hypothetical protein